MNEINISTENLIKNIEEGIILVDNSGFVKNMNKRAMDILNVDDSFVGKKYIKLMTDDSYNDDFHQMLLDAIADKKVVHKKRVPFIDNKGNKKVIYIASSLLEENDNQMGMLLSFDDVTIEEFLAKKNRNSSIAFCCLMLLLCVWLLASVIWNELNRPISQMLFGRLIMYLPLLFTPLAIKIFGFTIKDLGLSFKKFKRNLKVDFRLTIIAVLILVIVKLIIKLVLPDFSFYCANNRFFDFGKYTIFDYLEYFVCVISQEFLSRGLVYECVRRIIMTKTNKNFTDYLAIIVSSAYFSALHVYLGSTYMIGAFLLLTLFGFIYRKQGSIWGLCIPHFVLGQMIGILGFVAF